MKNPAKILLVLFGLFGVGIVTLTALFERIEPGVIGVKQNMWGTGGVIPEDYMVGYHWGVTGIHRWTICALVRVCSEGSTVRKRPPPANASEDSPSRSDWQA